MPGSDLSGKPFIRKWIEAHPDIKTIVDLGPGDSTYPKQVDGPEIYSGKGAHIWKAVEIWGPYIERFGLNKFYDEIRIGDIRYMEFPEGDCVIAGDVLEHLRREDFIKTLRKLEKQFKHIIASVPVNLLSDDVYEGNAREGHLSYWSISEMQAVFGPTYEMVNADPCMLFLK